MKSLFYTSLTILLLSACSLNVDTDQRNTITEEDVQAISRIIGESLSDENNGLIGSFYDAFSTYTSQGFQIPSNGRQKIGAHDQNSGRGSEEAFNYRFDPANGLHSISFERTVQQVDYLKSVQDTLTFLYRDSQGAAIEDLATAHLTARDLNYTARRTGSIDTPGSISHFSRQDTFMIADINAGGMISVDGIHHGSGFFETVSPVDSSIIRRAYTLVINFLNIQMEPVSLGDPANMEQRLSGSMTYELEIEDPERQEVSRNIQGSVRMIGDGTARLALGSAAELFQVNLDDGAVADQSSQFRGQVVAIDPVQGSFRLASGLLVTMSDETNIDPESDFYSLQAISGIWSELEGLWSTGTGSLDGSVFKADHIFFVEDDDADEDNNDRSFEKQVVSVDVQAGIVTLADNIKVGFDEQSRIDTDGDFLTLSAVQAALDQNIKVMGDIDAQYIDTPDLNYIAVEAEFENQEGDEEEGDYIDFDSEISSVDLSGMTLTLKNGARLLITAETRFTDEVTSLQEVNQRINQGERLQADGKGTPDPVNKEIDLIVIEIDIEEEDG